MRRTRGWDGMDQDPPSEPAGSVSTIAVILATSTPYRSPPESAVRTRGWSRPSHATAWSLPPRHHVRHGDPGRDPSVDHKLDRIRLRQDRRRGRVAPVHLDLVIFL